jgi:hypothetical protein
MAHPLGWEKDVQLRASKILMVEKVHPEIGPYDLDAYARAKDDALTRWCNLP